MDVYPHPVDRQSDDQLRDVIMSFVIAGRDTTANALSWLFDELLTHPDVEAKCVRMGWAGVYLMFRACGLWLRGRCGVTIGM